MNSIFIVKSLYISKFCCNFAADFSDLRFMARDEKNIIGYTIALVSEFANHFGVEPRQAYAYMKRYKGMEHLQKHYAILHTLSFPDTVEALAQVCAHNGGGLR